ncbi:MAG: hypothetical protein CME70_15890 [Halobacteriovorax sp.]|nr:hypothetical protein [Halobacteriovorax sp.]|tara:strand:+ start:45716 stop:47902 length:2187 start_codon:yes stop_codon:yes gene_type:complete
MFWRTGIFKAIFTHIFLLLIFASPSALACPGAADAMNKIVNAAVDGKKTPNINAKVFSNATDDLGEFTEVLVEGNKLKMYKNGRLVDVDPKDVKTIRAFAKDAQGRRVHTFVASQEKGQEAVSSFFKNIDSGKISPDDARALGNNFQKMSEADQATLVGGIENKLRRGEQITEAEFLIAVKGTPGFRTVPGPPPHLADIQKAFRSGNLDEAVDILAKSWKVHDASTETQGRVARIAKLLADNKGNRPVSALTDLGSSGKLPAKAGGAVDNPPAIIPGKGVAPTQTKAPALGKPPGKGVEPYVHNGQVMPRDNPVEVFVPKAKLESPAIDGKFTVVDDPALVLKADNAKPVGGNVPPKLVAPEQPKLLPAPKSPPPPPIKPVPYIKPNPPAEIIRPVLYSPSGAAIKPSFTSRYLAYLKKNKIKLAKIGAGIAGTILAACIINKKVYDKECIDRTTRYVKDPANSKEDRLKGAKIVITTTKNEDRSVSCEWSIVVKGEDGEDGPVNLTSDLFNQLEANHPKPAKFTWGDLTVGKEKDTDKELTKEEVDSIILNAESLVTNEEGNSVGVSCMKGDIPDQPCVLPEAIAVYSSAKLVMPASLKGPGGEEIDSSNECNNRLEKDPKPRVEDPKPAATSPSSTNDLPPGKKEEKKEEKEEEKEEDECETTDTDSDLPWYEAEKENCEKPPAQRVIDPFNILQGNDGVKQPLVPPQPIVVPPSNFPPYVTPGYY